MNTSVFFLLPCFLLLVIPVVFGPQAEIVKMLDDPSIVVMIICCCCWLRHCVVGGDEESVFACVCIFLFVRLVSPLKTHRKNTLWSLKEPFQCSLFSH